VILARLSDDLRLSDEVLAETRAWIGGKEAAAAKPKRRGRKPSSKGR
jgi:hypothetical protein